MSELSSFFACKSNPLRRSINDKFRKIHGYSIDWGDFESVYRGILMMRKDGLI